MRPPTLTLKALACLLALGFSAPAFAQGARVSSQSRQAAPERVRAPEAAPDLVARDQQQPAANADESFDLDIPLRRIVEDDFSASTEVEVEGPSVGLRVRVGAFVRAERVELVLRNVRGSVRFRASLDAVLRLLNGRRESTPAPAVPSP